MKLMKKLLCFLAALCILCSLFPAVYADGTDDERFKDKTWDEIVDAFFEEHRTGPGFITFGYYNTVTGEEHYYDGDKYVVAASLFKVPLNMLYTEKIANGEMDWDTKINGIAYSNMLEWTIVNSDNQMAEYLWKATGSYRTYRELICPYMGVDPETVDAMYWKNNYFTSEQMIHCLKTLYENPDRFPKVVDTMLKAEPDDYFNYHEQEFDIAHKYGYLEDDGGLYLNDCAICFTDDPILIVMFTFGIPKPYEALSDFCTLMCDYTQYQTALRREEEARQAEREAIQALESAAPEQTPAPAAGVGIIGGADGPTTIILDEGGGSAMLIPLALILVLLAVYLIAILLCAKKGKLKRSWAIAALVLGGAALILSVFAPSLGTLITAPAGDPQEAVTGFFDALSAGDYDGAYSYLSDYTSLGLENSPESEAGQQIYQALRQSYSYKLYGECSKNGLNASQQVLLTHLDLTALKADLKEATETALNQLVQTLPKDELYDENKNYLPSVTDTAYANAVTSLLGHVQDYYTTTGLELALTYTDGGWRIVTNNLMLNAICGGAAY